MEIEFKVWDKKNKAFINGFCMENFHSYFNKGLEPTISRYSTIWKLSEVELIQFTGLRDSSEDKIKLFKGDIIRSFDSQGNEIKHLISYDDSNACFCAEFIPYNRFNPSCGIKQSWIDEFEKVRIGNKFSNPELLTNNS